MARLTIAGIWLNLVLMLFAQQCVPAGAEPIPAREHVRNASAPEAKRQETANEQPRLIAQAAAEMKLTPTVKEVAQIIGAQPLLEQLHKEQVLVNECTPHTIECIERRQRVLYVRQRLVQLLDTSLYEINSVKGMIDASNANLADVQAVLNEHRARTIRRNSVINFVSGGITKMVGYSIAMAPVSLLTTNTLEVLDGGIQSTLSGLTYRDQHAESQMLKNVPDFLGVILDEPGVSSSDYPPSVWRYLNSVAPESTAKLTRKQVLVKSWKSNGILLESPKRNQLFNGKPAVSSGVAGKWIADHSAMLYDLKSVVSQMNDGLMALSELVKQSYNQEVDF
jgi:hypothetical protein